MSSLCQLPNRCAVLFGPDFRGGTTVVTKRLNLVQPDIAFFGQKDFQRCAVIRRVVRNLNLAVEIATVPTVREADGLALSSHNSCLSLADRERARCLRGGLLAAQAAYGKRERDRGRLVEMAQA